LPRPSIDTGAGLERILTLVQGVDAVWETDLMQPLIDTACSVTGTSYRPGDYDDRASFAVRVLAEHARSATTELRVRCFAATGCGEHEVNPRAEDDFVVPLNS